MTTRGKKKCRLKSIILQHLELAGRRDYNPLISRPQTQTACTQTGRSVFLFVCVCVFELLGACLTVTHLVSHYHRRASVDSQNWKLCLNRQEVKDLGDGLLVGAVGEHNAMETGASQELAHLETQEGKQTQVKRRSVCLVADRMCNVM